MTTTRNIGGDDPLDREDMDGSALADNGQTKSAKGQLPVELDPYEVSDEKVEIPDDSNPDGQGEPRIPDDRPWPQPLELPPPSLSPWTSVLWLFIATVAFWGIGSAAINLVELWRQSLPIGILLTIIALVLAYFIAKALWHEYQAIKDVDKLADRQQLIQEALDSKDLASLKSALRETIDSIERRRPKLIQQFRDTVAPQYDVDGYLDNFKGIVLAQLDLEAEEVVGNGAIATGAAVAIVPHPAFDALVVLWRSLEMTRRIGGIYGLRPGGVASWRLLSYSVKSALLAASMQTVSDLLTESFASTLVGIFGTAGQGVAIGLRVYHVGHLTIATCRPIKA